jgi:Family of unknown function (DUF6528)
MCTSHGKLTLLVVFVGLNITTTSAVHAEAGRSGAGIAAVAAVTAPLAARAVSGHVGIVDQRHGVMIFDLASPNWTGEAPWSWQPRGAQWRNLSDVKFRSYGGRNTVLVTASGGGAAIIDHATHRVTWSAQPGGNPHSIELLPTGAVVVASSTGNRLSLYGKGRTTDPTLVEFSDAHGVLWDAATHRLWVLGRKLCSYQLAGSATSPELTGRTCMDAKIDGGHDLSPVHGNAVELWFSTSKHVYVYNVNRGTRSPAAGRIDNRSIKSVGNQPGGLVITTQVKGENADGTWGTGNVWLYNQNGSYVGNRFRPGAAIYKARPVIWDRR